MTCHPQSSLRGSIIFNRQLVRDEMSSEIEKLQNHVKMAIIYCNHLNPVSSYVHFTTSPKARLSHHKTPNSQRAWGLIDRYLCCQLSRNKGFWPIDGYLCCVAFLSITLIMGVPSYVVAPHHVQSPTHPPLNFSSALQLVLYVREGYKCQNSMVN